VLKKQTKKNIASYILGLLISIVLAPLLLGVFLVPEPAGADTPKYCTYSPPEIASPNPTENVPRTITDSVIPLQSNPSPRGDKSGIKGSFQVLYETNSDKYRLSGCSSVVSVTGRIGANLGISGRASTISVNDQIPISDLVFTEQGGALKITGTFVIPDFMAILQPDIATDIKNNWVDTSPYKAYFNLMIKEGNVTTPVWSKDADQSDLNFFGCNNKTLICAKYTEDGRQVTSDPTQGAPNSIALNEIKFGLSTSLTGDNLKYSPESRKAGPLHNFVRLYINSSGNIQGFNFQSGMFLTSPTDKTLNINNNGVTSQIYLTTDSNGTIVKKDAKFLGTGVTDPKQSFRSSTDYGCIIGETSTHYAPLTGNVTRTFNLCNPVSLKTTDSVSIKAGGTGFDFTVPLGDTELRKLKTLTLVTCQDEAKGTGCDQAVNVVDVGAILGLDENVAKDSSWSKAFLALLGLPGVAYNLYDAYTMVKQQWTYLNGLPITGIPQSKLYIQIYKNEDAWKANIDSPIPDTVPEPKEVETSVGSKDQSTSQTLYAFIIRVISNIIVWLQSIIYTVFAYVVVPVLNALLKIRPYQDAFVSVIYPGWLILRNLANIFFIVALLVVGLKILFQQSAAGTARGFIMRLVVMALLVNFSLVIAQGIIGIADTVQSQFLPANSKVIEALGSKLMVEPLKTFRTDVAGDSGIFDASNSENALADTVKPIVLLILSVASFFSFVAIAAFLAVRLVALWVLYMVSPVAYVGFVMDETKGYAKQWWNEFIKYAIMTPVLVFFLNIAALMATVFSGSNNTLFKFSDSLTGDIVAGGLTIMTHFIVLFFIFIGMKYALGSGVYGAKEIVNYAQKGFNNLTTRPAKWAANTAKDFTKDAAKTQWDRRFKGGMFDPFAYRDAFKKKVADTTKQKYSDRILRKADKFSPAGLMENPTQSLRYLLNKARGKGPKNYLNAAERKIDQSETLTLDERDSLVKKLDGETARLSPLQSALDQLHADSPLETNQGRDLVTHLDTEIARLNTEGAALASELETEGLALRRQGNNAAADAKDNQAKGILAEYLKKEKDLKDARDSLDAVVVAAETHNENTLSLDDGLKEDITEKLDKDIKDLAHEIKTLETRKEEDDRRISIYGDTPMTKEQRRLLQQEANQLNKEAVSRSAPESAVVRQVRRESEDEAKKKIEDTDDAEELIAQYKKAWEKNNLPLASAIAKKLATEGSFSDLLKEFGYRNNMQSLQEFVGDHFKKYAPQVRLQIMSEIGSINEKNGNRAASRAVKIDSDTGRMRLATPTEHAAKHDAVLAKKPMNEAKKMKKNDFGQEGSDGRLQLYKGAAKMLSQFKSIKKPDPTAPGYNPNMQVEYERKIRDFQRDMAPTARAILEATNSNLIDPAAILVLEDIGKV
jgi:hypothetical protein